MSTPDRVGSNGLAGRVAQELGPGQVVALGLGLPALVPGQMLAESGVMFLSEGGALGYKAQDGPVADSDGQAVGLNPGGTVISSLDLAAMSPMEAFDALRRLREEAEGE